jgi:TonB family protein
MGTLIFHIVLVTIFLVAELNKNVKIQDEEAILLDFTIQNDKNKIQEPELEKQTKKNTVSDQSVRDFRHSGSNRAVNDANIKKMKDDKFFDENYKRDIEEAKKVVADVNRQLSKKVASIKKYEMPDATTEGQNPDSVKNVIYAGKSNIHYFLENRFHVRLPIPVYLAKSGGEIKVDIQVDRSGKVIKAEANRFNGDQQLLEYALQAAERTVFNTDKKAPLVQKGNITYKFVAQ